jgi:hypothetical protein
MWDNLSPADIERAKEQLTLQRDAVLKRHAEELSVLDADQNEIETLDQLIAAFLQSREPANSQPAPEPAVAAATAPEPPPLPPTLPSPLPPTGNTGDRPAAAARQPNRRDYSGTNFDTFSKAVSKLL